MVKGYKGRDPHSHRQTKLRTLVKRFKTGKITYRGKGKLRGSGHAAGRDWGEKKGIDPSSRTLKYSNNSPSFDEGVWQYKQRKQGEASERKTSLAKRIR